jgi:hypothetical protein
MLFDRHHAGPLPGLTRSERRSWRRTARRVAAEHRAELAAGLAALTGQPIIDLGVGPTGTVAIQVPGWQIGLVGVTPWARDTLFQLQPAHQPLLVAGGAPYGRFWWIALTATPARRSTRTTILGSHLRIDPIRWRPHPFGVSLPTPTREVHLAADPQPLRPNRPERASSCR